MNNCNRFFTLNYLSKTFRIANLLFFYEKRKEKVHFNIFFVMKVRIYG